jgi:NAD(P)-dependent dehydrogenase (short-subunit alcohol dehydrogenase family)
MAQAFAPGATAIVTGAGSGIGRATADAFAREGVKVVVSDISEASAAETAARIGAAGGTASVCVADVSQEGDIRRLIDTALSVYGRLDCAFNNAGINIEFNLDYDVAEFDRTMAINCRSVFLAMKYEIDVMLKQGGGSIANTGSVLGLVGNARQPGYVASKHAVVGLTQQAALQFGPQGIRVNAVCPGPIETPMITKRPGSDLGKLQDFAQTFTALKRLGRPEEIAEAVIWLSSTKASYVTGSAVLVDGGFTAA